jgi:uncharacterized membrane protein/uncharacterized membrane protein YeaQ/YmgE (transglycosylase-associated protein family)
MNSLIWIASGLAAGALARIVLREQSRGFLGDVVLGALGSVTGAWLLRLVHGVAPPGMFAQVLTAVMRAVALFSMGRLVMSAARSAGMTSARVGTTLTDLDSQVRRLTELERTVLSRLLGRPSIPLDTNESFLQQQTLGERVADHVAAFGGSWTFLGLFAAFMLGWMFLNTESARPLDPYPFILLNLVLSCLAAVQAPVIMMSQKRQAAKDRLDAQQDYQVNLRAEMQITALHLKLDDARTSQWQEVVTLHQKQLEVLERIERQLEGRA